ncbi:MAG: PAAR-like domain-containing protein [Candidatus Thiodiazotropha sp.]|nr:DUF4150 domain-containing protein [Candidatus Thiodiazotropha taylori]MBT3058020.1 DUF4150 domain-containing protein [Candidatus Thiodiazotropha sp. (ex Lucina pensylvanica)]MBT3064844.1 DUF4150 domain-containing protein [Candidatus Thiodiazotropha sp. (ex Lucina pensylvanica)]MBV2093560.1 DUF4150 domain-containing protein [Candidatus Thiodiazotropha sp. (ex Codakia orbicularis)]PUB77438.1 MAG: hypothetical protein DBP03_03120 [gamma proteobacterium symbiont of Ctena orbiculata]
MANNVFANGLEIACKAADGMSKAAFPDPCFTPPPPSGGWVLVPYANTAFAKDLANGSTTVFISGLPVAKKDHSFIKTSTGNEPAAGPKGLKTGVKKGKAYFTSWSMNVKVEGLNVCRHTDGMTHNHGSYPGNTIEWRYLDSGYDSDCSDEIKRVKKYCAENDDNDKKKSKKKHGSRSSTNKNKDQNKPSSWKHGHCDGLMKLPKKISMKDLEDLIPKIEDKIKSLDLIDGVKQKVMDTIQDKVLTKGLKMAAKKPLQAVLGPLGWAWAAYDVIDAAVEVYQIKNYLDEITAEAKRIKQSIQDLPNKLKEVQAAIKNGDQEKASELMAEMQQYIALMDACIRARKCMLVPFNDNKKSPRTNMNNKKGCCPGQTGHHMIPDGYMRKKTICHKYTEGSAPTVCVEGTTQTHGSHGSIHRKKEKHVVKKLSNGTIEYEDVRDAAIKAHRSTFPLSLCSSQCLLKQLDNYYHDRCENHRGLFGGAPNPDLKYCKICKFPKKKPGGEAGV